MNTTTLKAGLLMAGIALSSSALANSFTLVRTNLSEILPGEPFEVQVRLRLGENEYLTGYGLDLNLPESVMLNQVSYPQWATSDSMQDVAASVNPATKVSSGTVLLATLELEASEAGSFIIEAVGDDLVNSGAFINTATHELTPIVLSKAIEIEVMADVAEVSEEPKSDTSGGSSMGWMLALTLLAARRLRR